MGNWPVWMKPLLSGVRWCMKKGRGQATGWGQCFVFPSVLQHCWLGDRKDIWPLKNPCHLPQRLTARTHGRRKTIGNQLTQVYLENQHDQIVITVDDKHHMVFTQRQLLTRKCCQNFQKYETRWSTSSNVPRWSGWWFPSDKTGQGTVKKTDERHDAAWEHSPAVLDTCTTHTQANSASYPQIHTHARWFNGLSMRIRVIKVIWIITPCCSFSAFTLLAGQQKVHAAHKKLLHKSQRFRKSGQSYKRQTAVFWWNVLF